MQVQLVIFSSHAQQLSHETPPAIFLCHDSPTSGTMLTFKVCYMGNEYSVTLLNTCLLTHISTLMSVYPRMPCCINYVTLISNHYTKFKTERHHNRKVMPSPKPLPIHQRFTFALLGDFVCQRDKGASKKGLLDKVICVSFPLPCSCCTSC